MRFIEERLMNARHSERMMGHKTRCFESMGDVEDQISNPKKHRVIYVIKVPTFDVDIIKENQNK